MWVSLEVLDARVSVEPCNPMLRTRKITLETRKGTVEIEADVDTLLELRDLLDEMAQKRQTATVAPVTA